MGQTTDRKHQVTEHRDLEVSLNVEDSSKSGLAMELGEAGHGQESDVERSFIFHGVCFILSLHVHL